MGSEKSSSIGERLYPASNIVTVRWHDGYKEKFLNVIETRFGSDLLFIRYKEENGKIKNRHIPLRSVRWFSMDEESHEDTPFC